MRLMRHYREAMLSDGSLVYLSKDGLLYLIKREDVLDKLRGLPQDDGGIYFNEEKDRYCAEYYDSEYMFVNPSIVEKYWGTLEVVGD